MNADQFALEGEVTEAIRAVGRGVKLAVFVGGPRDGHVQEVAAATRAIILPVPASEVDRARSARYYRVVVARDDVAMDTRVVLYVHDTTN